MLVLYRITTGAFYGFSDEMSTITQGRRDVPYMIDNNPSMYRYCIYATAVLLHETIVVQSQTPCFAVCCLICRPRLFGANAIIEHLMNEYGPGYQNPPTPLPKPKSKLPTGGFNFFGSDSSGDAKTKGKKLRSNARPDNAKMKALTLYGWEGAKFVTPVREALNELALPHLFVNCAAGSANRLV